MNTEPKYGAFSSAVDPQQLGTTVIATAKTIAGALVFFGLLTTADTTTILAHVNTIITDVLVIVPLVYAMWHSGEIVFGLLQKAIVAFAKKPTLPAPVAG